MDKAKRVAPPPQNRDVNGRFTKGCVANPGGRPKKDPAIKAFCQQAALPGIEHLAGLLYEEATKANEKVAIVRLMMEYGYGRPAAEFDRERLEMDKRRLEHDLGDGSDNNIKLHLGKELEEFAE